MAAKPIAFSLTMLLALAGCAALPASGPSSGDIKSERTGPAKVDYVTVDVDSTVVEALKARVDDRLSAVFPEKGGGAGEAIGVGDFVSVTIWEAALGGLFSGAGNQINGSKTASIPEQPVANDGTIVVPYAGVVRVAGNTPTEVKSIIEQALAGKAIEPQVLVSVTKPISNTATVTGEVVRGGQVPLSIATSRILDAIAHVGGVGAPIHEVFLQLDRRGRSARVPLQVVIDNPAENVRLQPRDTLIVLRNPQSFTTFGATGASARVAFEAKGMMLDEAIAKVGGLRDIQADPAGVFIFRYEKPAIVARLRPDHPDLAKGVKEIPIVYRVNLRDPGGLFIAKSFRVYDKDLIFVANAKVTELQKFMQLISTLVQPVQTGAAIQNSFQN